MPTAGQGISLKSVPPVKHGNTHYCFACPLSRD
jgi:hypothetical protein